MTVTPVEITRKAGGRRIGTPPGAATRRAPGRHTVVSDSKGGTFLYVPEVQELFGLSPELSHVLQLGLDEPSSPLGVGARDLVVQLAEDHAGGPLNEARHSHRELRDVVVHPSQVCNLDCVYCYATDFNKVNKLMSAETADAVVRHTVELSGSDGLASVKFLGGEPTLAWPIVERMMAGYVTESERRGLAPPHFVMVTNGTRITEALAASAAAHGMHVLVSLDGDRAIHDRLRPTRSGAGSYELATRGLETLIAAGVEVSVEGVYTRDHYVAGVSVSDMIDHFLALGVTEFAIAPTVGIWHDADTIDEIDPVREMFVDAARRSVRSFRTSSPHLLRGIQFVLDGFSMRERRQYVCGAGRTFMAVNWDGEAFPCYLLESPATSYGVLADNWDDGRYQAVRAGFVENGKDHHEVCSGCWANEICQSCLGTSWQISPEITKPPAWFCGFQKALISAVLGEVAAARQSDEWGQFLVNMEAHLRPLGEAV